MGSTPNSDNDSAFINETLLNYCQDQGIEFTRSRAYRKNDQAWIEQKNGSVVRRFVGHERYSGTIAGQTMAHLYGAVRLYVNHFQPSFQLLSKGRNGGSVTKRYRKPATPCDTLRQAAERNDVSEETKRGLRDMRTKLDPISLLHTVREAQSALVTVSSSVSGRASRSESLEQFLGKLPDLWRRGEVRPTHEKDAPKARAPHTWRTHPDPFEGVWCEILHWLQKEPDATATVLLDRLIRRHPDRFSRRQLRTLQRRVRQWRSVMASKLVYASAQRSAEIKANPGDIGRATVRSRRYFGNTS